MATFLDLRVPVQLAFGNLGETAYLVGSLNRLPVDIGGASITIAPGDVEIGAVELKNATTDDRAVVVNSAPAGTEFSLCVRQTGALPAGTNVIGHAIIDSGSTTAVTQATGTNLHCVIDSGTITTVTTVTAVTAITNALPAGTNAIGKLAANSGVDIGDVDVLTVNGVAPAFGAGAVGATVQRFVLATDTTVPNVTGNVADDGVDSGNPVKVGGIARDPDSLPANATAADRRDLQTDLKGRLIVYLGTKLDSTNDSVTAVGSVAHDAVDSGNPVKTGCIAINAERTAVANLDRVDNVADLTGKPITLPYANPENFISGKTAAITGTADTAVIASQGGSLRIYVTSITVTNSHATVGTEVLIKNGTTELLRVYVSSVLASSNNVTVTFPVPLKLTAATALNAANITTGSNTYVSAQGYSGV